MRAILREFREFAMRGNVLDMAVGIVIGASFGALIFGTVRQGIFYTGVNTDWFQVFLGGMLLIAVIFNTIRLQVMTQREEIEVSKLIGATDAFIRRPFYYQGLVQGLAGGMVALLVVLAVGVFMHKLGISMALGAFLAGMVVAQSPVSHQAAADALPMRDAFAVLFFVSVGMLFDPRILIEQPAMILAALAIIMLAKPLVALVIVAVIGHSARTALTVAIGLAQIGEFSFILSDLARSENLMPPTFVVSAVSSASLVPLPFEMTSV